MSGALNVTVIREAQCSRLSDVACSLGKRDRPFPEGHERAVWTIAVVRRGTFQYRTSASNRVHALRPGWLLVGTPDAAFECSHDRDGGDDCTSLAIGEDVLWDVGRAHGVAIEKLLPSIPALPPIPRVAALLERTRVHDGSDLDEVGYLIAASVVAQASGMSRPGLAPPAKHVRRVHDAIERIESSYKEPLSLAELAGSAGFSPFHFLRVFRRVTGKTPHQYVLAARLRTAARLLLDTQRPVTDIAYDVGFQDLSNFVRTFHRVIGTSPSAYRRR